MQIFKVRPRILYPMAFAALVIFGMTALLLLGRDIAVGAAQETLVAIVVPQQPRTGESIVVEIVATGAQDLAGFQAGLRFDDTQLRVTSIASGTGLGSSGRDVVALPPVTRPNMVVLGAVTCPVSNCNEKWPQNATTSPQGVSGRIVLGTINFYTEATGEYQLALDNVQVVDPQGNRLPTLTTNATLTVLD